MTIRIAQPPAAASLHVAETRARTAPREEGRGFGRALRSGADVVLKGVEVGATVVGGPIAGAAVREVRQGIAPRSGGPLGGNGTGADHEQTTMDEMRAMQQESQAFNMQYLALQEEVQQENRRFSTISNVLKAKHETAKTAIANIRA